MLKACYAYFNLYFDQNNKGYDYSVGALDTNKFS